LHEIGSEIKDLKGFLLASMVVNILYNELSARIDGQNYSKIRQKNEISKG
jgi:hypothetical protein